VRGIWRALPPIVAGHALSIGAVLVVVGLAQLVMPAAALNVVVAAMLISMGVYRLWRHGHPRFGGMRVGFRDLTLWSFLMASAHGAGLMVLPFLTRTAAPVAAAGHQHLSTAQMGTSVAVTDALALATHTVAYFVVMTLAAWLVYRKVGLRLLRSAWFNMDRVWAAALAVTGIVVLLT
jgi:hypothetical protein